MDKVTVYGKFLVDRKNAEEFSHSPWSWFEMETSWLEESGITLYDSIATEDDLLDIKREYLKYLIGFSFDNFVTGNVNPMSYEQWLETIKTEE